MRMVFANFPHTVTPKTSHPPLKPTGTTPTDPRYSEIILSRPLLVIYQIVARFSTIATLSPFVKIAFFCVLHLLCVKRIKINDFIVKSRYFVFMVDLRSPWRKHVSLNVSFVFGWRLLCHRSLMQKYFWWQIFEWWTLDASRSDFQM